MQTDQAGTLATATQEWAGELRYVSRQPILNLRGRVHGYELLFRHGPDALSRGEGDIAARTMLDNAVIFGLERFTDGLPAFIGCSAEALTERLVHVLPPGKAILGIPASLEKTTRLVEACRELKAQGFGLALDDFTWNANVEPLVRLADYIRVDFTRLGASEREHLRRLNSGSLSVVAKKVETQEDYKQACSEGFTLFQGCYFCHPMLLKKTKLPSNRISHFEIVRLLHHDPIDVQQITRLVMSDAALTYRVLRLVNSPIYALHRELSSIESAIIILGDDTLRRILSLAILSEMNADQPPEILHMALVRARFCELAARSTWLDPAEQYLLGMFSLVPAMLRLPMEELTSSLPLRRQICDALLGTANAERSLLTWLEHHERGHWEASDSVIQTVGITQEKMNQCYAEALIWARAAVSSAVSHE